MAMRQCCDRHIWSGNILPVPFLASFKSKPLKLFHFVSFYFIYLFFRPFSPSVCFSVSLTPFYSFINPHFMLTLFIFFVKFFKKKKEFSFFLKCNLVIILDDLLLFKAKIPGTTELFTVWFIIVTSTRF